jgi:hypothetical protein
LTGVNRLTLFRATGSFEVFDLLLRFLTANGFAPCQKRRTGKKSKN